MLAIDFKDNRKAIESYKSYRAEQFNKKLAKARNLINSVDETSLTIKDKALLKRQITDLFNF